MAFFPSWENVTKGDYFFIVSAVLHRGMIDRPEASGLAFKVLSLSYPFVIAELVGHGSTIKTFDIQIWDLRTCSKQYALQSAKLAKAIGAAHDGEQNKPQTVQWLCPICNGAGEFELQQLEQNSAPVWYCAGCGSQILTRDKVGEAG